MTKKEENLDWIYYIIGLVAGMLIVISITFSFLWIIFGGILGLIFGGMFLNNVVKGRHS